MKTFIFDIDGTLADISHRVHFIPNWDKFQQNQMRDALIDPIAIIFNSLLASGYKLILVTGRKEKERAVTINWLKNNLKIQEEDIHLIMRPDTDHSPDDDLKQRVLNRLKKDGIEIIAVFEDRQRVVDMWRKNGVTCLQVADGNY